MNDPLLAVSAVLSSLHVLALAIGLPAAFFRGRALKGTLDDAGVARVLAADNLWGLAAVLWIVTGTMRAFGGFEKGTSFYMRSPLFHAKLGLFVLVLVLEVWPMVTLMGWRVARARGQKPDTSRARALSTINHIEMALVGIIVFVASFMARGFLRQY
jgi:putative membrane protein